MQQDTETSKDSALREVGRTVANFQQLEHNLKLAASLGPLQGTLPKIQTDIARRRERAANLTLGQAIQAWLKYSDGSELASAWTPDLFDVSIRMTFTLESDVESRKLHAATLSALLENRNDLIHARLVRFRWDSPTECALLIRELAAINAAVSVQLEYIRSLVSQIMAAQIEHAEAVLADFE